MPSYIVRQDNFGFRGTLLSVLTPLDVSAPVLMWSLIIKPAPGHEAVATTANGVANPDGNVTCQVAVPQTKAPWGSMMQMLGAGIGRRVFAAGTLCDVTDVAGTMAAILPLGLLAIQHPLQVYDIDNWPVPVRDYDLMAFAHAKRSLLGEGEPHEGESVTVSTRIPFPFRPSDAAHSFFRAYRSTRIDHASSRSFTADDIGKIAHLDIEVETGDPEQDEGFLFVQLGLTYDEPDLDNYCPPGTCQHDGKFCSHDGVFRYTRMPPVVPYARKGDLALSPGDGRGLISGIVASLTPFQVYDHMGMFIDNGRTIRHCTASEDRAGAKDLFTEKLTIKLAGVIELADEPAPLNGIRPDIMKFVWPGSITQTVEEVFRTGRNSLNARWSFAGTHPGSDTADPEDPGKPFRIYHLDPAARERRIKFNDPERDKIETIVRLQETPTFVGSMGERFDPVLVRPQPVLDSDVRPSLDRVVEVAKKIDAHYRFFAYSKGEICFNSDFISPPVGDPAWAGLPAGADWSAGTIPAMCSSFVWAAIQIANKERPPGTLRIILEDQREPEDPDTGREYGARDGFYLYHEKERREAAKNLVSKLAEKVRDSFDENIPAAAYAALPHLALIRDQTASRVANQTANTFAFDKSEDLGKSWEMPGDGETVSPHDVLRFWDAKPIDSSIKHPEGGLAAYGDILPIQLSAETWTKIPLFRKHDEDPGRGDVFGVAFVDNVATAGVTVRIDFGCHTYITTDNLEQAYLLKLEAGTHFAEAFILLPNPVTGQLETFRTPKPVPFEVIAGQTVRVDLVLEPPSDLWRVVEVDLDADIHDRSFWGGDADHKRLPIKASFELRQDLGDDPDAPREQRNTVLRYQSVWRTEPEVGSGVHVAMSIIANFEPSDRSVKCHCEIALIDTDSGGFLGIGTSSDVDQLEKRDVSVAADQTADVLVDFDFASDETVPERARVTCRLKNRRRQS